MTHLQTFHGVAAANQKHCVLRAWLVAVQAFGLFDLNGDGCMSVEEVGQVLQRLGLREVHAADAVLQYDTNSDGQIDYREFSAMMA